MAMVIYKIVNMVNNKVYIGQTIRPIEQRFARHVNDAHHNPETTLKLHRAINKYGESNFTIEKIDEASSQNELNEKEKYWIKYYDSMNNGYNLTEGGDGGNTYLCRTSEQMKSTSEKIAKSKIGRLNPMSKQFKAKSVITGKEYFFETLDACLKFLGTKHKATVVDRADGKCHKLWRNEWMFAYENEDYPEFHEFHYDPSCRKGQKVVLTKNGESFKFNSINKACQFLGLKRMKFLPGMVVNDYSIEFP